MPCVGSVVPSLIWSASRRRAHGAVSVCQVKRMAVVYLEETNLIKPSLVFWLRPQEALCELCRYATFRAHKHVIELDYATKLLAHECRNWPHQFDGVASRAHAVRRSPVEQHEDGAHERNGVDGVRRMRSDPVGGVHWAQPPFPEACPHGPLAALPYLILQCMSSPSGSSAALPSVCASQHR